MTRQYKVIKSRISRQLRWVFSITLLFLLLLTSAPMFAQGESEVGAVLCSSEAPNVQITQPLSDSVSDVPTIQIQGTAIYTSQIDILINGVYSHTIAIGFDTIVQTQVSLQEGTNTITLQAYFSCNGLSTAYDIIIDYQPKITPSNPGTVDTELKSSISSRSLAPEASLLSRTAEKTKEKLGIDVDRDPSSSGMFYKQSFVRVAFSWLIFTSIITLLGILFAPRRVNKKIENLLGLHNWSMKHGHRFTRFNIAILIVLLAAIFSIS